MMGPSMRLEWIEDIIAVMETGSLARAAERRFVTQSAFTRRIRMIETSIGADLFDRNHKPIKVLPAVRALEPDLREAASRLVKLRSGLRDASNTAASTLAFACQHAITATVSPRIVAALTETPGVSVRVRSGNHDECMLMILSGEVDFALMYDSQTFPNDIPHAFDRVILDREWLIPVCTPALRAAAEGPEIPVISYPAEVFLGRFFALNLAPRLPPAVSVVSRAEAALTLAVYRYALNGTGIAWLPQTLVQAAIGRGELCRLDDILPSGELDLQMLWLTEPRRPHKEKIRRDLLNLLYPRAGTTHPSATTRTDSP